MLFVASEPMFLGALLISGRDWLWPALLLLAAAVVALAWAYRGARVQPGTRAACVLLKFLGLAALFACLLEPLWSGQRARPGANYVAILADNSQGMQIKDQADSRSRGDALRELLTSEEQTWQPDLEENFQVRRYQFDSRLQFVKNFGELAFDGRASSIGGALQSLAERFRSQPLAGVLLFTDGNATDLAEGTLPLSGLPPVYPVLVGTDAAIKDIALQKVTVTQTAFEDAPVTIQAAVAATGFSGIEILARLTELEVQSGTNAPSEKPTAESRQTVPTDGEPIAFRFQVRPEKSGIRFYRLRVSAAKEAEQFVRPEISTEATLANNTSVITVDRGRGPHRVLYVAGRPNWEYKFFRRAVEEDDQVQLSALIRIAKREPKMEFRGHAGESSNPLYRGFGNQSVEEAERYDQPVIRPIAVNNEEFDRLRGGFPKTAEALFRYHAVILDDLEAEFFNHDQMVLLQKFVSERGGGLLMLGGQESFYEGNFARTPIGEMLPIYLDRPAERVPSAGYRMNLTREGWLQPWARLRDNELDEKKRLVEMPAFQVLNLAGSLKPGAIPVATVSDGSGKSYPALVVQRFGNGRTAALTIGDMWRWGLKDEESHKDMDKAWRQMVRLLVADVPDRIEAEIADKPSDPDQAVLVRVRVHDEKFQPLENATVTLTVQPISGEALPSPIQAHATEPSTAPPGPVRLPAEAIPSEPGVYQATYIPRQTGGYLVQAAVTNAVGADVGRTESGWSSDPAALEFRSLKPNRALLEEIASRTGGEVIEPGRLQSFASSLPQRKVPVAESWTLPLWHQPAVFLFALACFIGEWGLRRWKGMP
ncbi:MAG: glutamine amidotransferase [Verrucomicrobiia bacterium]